MPNEKTRKNLRICTSNSPSQGTVTRRKALRGIGAFALSAPLLSCGDSGSESPEAGASEASGGATSSTSPAQTSQAGTSSSGTSGRPATPTASGSAGQSGSKAAASSGGTKAPAPTGGTTSGTAGAGTGGTAGASAAGTGGTPAAEAGAGGSTSAAGAGGTAATGTGTIDFGALDCVLTPEMTEGPFFVEEDLDRADLVTGDSNAAVTSGLPLELTLGVFRVNGDECTAFANAKVDIWHADVEGLYSDVAAGFFQPTDTSGKDFLRAYQVTNESGLVTFKTIYPGWYGTRTIHIHFKIRIAGGGTSNYDFTSQMYFDEKINDEVMELGPYNSRGARTVRNMNDQVFNGTGPGAGADDTPPPNGVAPGAGTTVTLTPLASGKGYAATLKIGVMMS